MTAPDQLHAVVGATGGAGGALVRELAGRGHRVRAVSRKPAADLPEGAEQLAADAADPAQARKACQGATVVYHCAQPPYERWAAQFPTLTASLAEAAAGAGARLVYADNLYAYGPVHRPLTEDLPAPATTNKGRVRVLATSRLTLRIAGLFDPRARESAEMLYQWERPFVVDASKFQRAFGPFEPTPDRQAVATTVAWFQQRAGRTRR